MSADEPTTSAFELGLCRPDEAAQVVAVLAAGDEGWATSDLQRWSWMYRRRPGAHPEDSLVLRDGERIVGCTHQAIMDWQLGSGIVVPTSIGTDLVVLDEYRGQGLASRLMDASIASARERGAVLQRGNAVSPELWERFYGPLYGYQFVPNTADERERPVLASAIVPLVEYLGVRLRAVASDDNITLRRIEIRVARLAPVLLSIDEHRAWVGDVDGEPPDLVVHIHRSVDVVTLVGHRRRAALRLPRWVALRRIRVQGARRRPRLVVHLLRAVLGSR